MCFSSQHVWFRIEPKRKNKNTMRPLQGMLGQRPPTFLLYENSVALGLRSCTSHFLIAGEIVIREKSYPDDTI